MSPTTRPPCLLLRASLGLAGLLLALAAAPAPAQAQGRGCREAETRMDDVQRQLDHARDMLRDCRSAEPRKFYDGATDALRRARDESGRGECRRAAILTETALRLAARAVDACREGDGEQDQLGRYLDRTDGYLREAADAARGSGGECETLLRVAAEDQRKARDAFRGDRLRISLKLTLRSQELCERVLACVEEGGVQGEIPVQNALLRTDHVLKETERLLRDRSGGEQALTILGSGRRMQEQSWRSFRAGRFGLALGLTRQARSMANQSLLELDVDLDRDEVARLVAGADEFVSRLESTADPEASEARTLLRRAREQIDGARAALAGDDLRGALVHARAASGLATDAASRLETDEDR